MSAGVLRCPCGLTARSPTCRVKSRLCGSQKKPSYGAALALSTTPYPLSTRPLSGLDAAPSLLCVGFRVGWGREPKRVIAEGLRLPARACDGMNGSKGQLIAPHLAIHDGLCP